MSAIEQQTRDYALALDGTEWADGATFADHAHRNYGACLEVSGDMLAIVRADLRASEIGEADCG